MPDEILSFASGEPSRERLEELLALARTYRGWTNRELANALDRDVHSVVPSTGNPKLDLVVKLAAILEWPVEMVVADLYDRTTLREAPKSSKPFDAQSLNREAWEAVIAERFDHAGALAQSVERAAESSADDRAYAALIGAYVHQANGRYPHAIESIRRGLRLVDADSCLGTTLRKDLAYHYYAIGELAEAEGIASGLVSQWGQVGRSDRLRAVLADALHVRGSCRRVRAGRRAEGWALLASRAIDDLNRTIEICEAPSLYGGPDHDRWVASAAQAGIVDLRCLLGEMSPEAAVDRIFEILGDGSEEGRLVAELESRAWWAIIGCGIVIRHEQDPDRIDRLLAIFTNKADEIAGMSGNWALRERVWQVEHLWRVERSKLSHSISDMPLDADDLRSLAGTMGRFPAFRETGWRILHSRQIARGDS